MSKEPIALVELWSIKLHSQGTMRFAGLLSATFYQSYICWRVQVIRLLPLNINSTSPKQQCQSFTTSPFVFFFPGVGHCDLVGPLKVVVKNCNVDRSPGVGVEWGEVTGNSGKLQLGWWGERQEMFVHRKE